MHLFRVNYNKLRSLMDLVLVMKIEEVRDHREARVMRYKEKRLKRLYNKQIQYEVCKTKGGSELNQY